MSSIYKKGRDGYYYYQTYVYNPESKKKDKRVFHALRTKDPIEAKIKQNELDMQYDDQDNFDSNLEKKSFGLDFKSTILIVIGTILLTILFTDHIRSTKIKKDKKKLMINEALKLTEKMIDQEPKTIDNSDKIDDGMDRPQMVSKTGIVKIEHDKEINESEIIIPKYTIERVDRLSGPFEQGKIYVTIDKNTNNQSQRQLCKNLVKRYNEFSNIIICLYSNNDIGKKIASGNDELVRVEDQKRFWLAMYTYNSVEGEYFDDNPTSYLGIH